MVQNRLAHRMFAGLMLMFLGAGAAVANPKINEVLTAYSTAGAPVSINLLGTSLCTGSPCVAPIVTVGGKSVSLSAYSTTSITVKLPQPLTLGDYTLKVVTADGSTTFELTLANLATQGPAGPGAMLVKDGTGKVVGSYVYTTSTFGQSQFAGEFVFIRAFTMPFTIGFTAAHLGSSLGGGGSNPYQLAYTSSDCSGPAYIQPTGTVAAALRFAVVGGTTAYVGGTTVAHFAGNSFLLLTPGGANGSCFSSSGGQTYGLPVVATFDLSTLNLVPPFTVH